MSELDELQQGRDESLRQQRMKELIAHLTVLSTNVDVALKKARHSELVWVAGALVWIGSSFADVLTHGAYYLQGFGVLIYIFALSYSMAMRHDFVRAYSAYMATIKVLEILGIVDPRPPQAPKNKKKVFEEGITLVKKWAAQKKTAQEKVYQPA